jgi:hypothetical protein
MAGSFRDSTVYKKAYALAMELFEIYDIKLQINNKL